MFKSKMFVFVLLGLAFTASLAYCQGKTEARKLLTIIGTADKVDAVGNIIEVRINKGLIMAFSVPDDATITGDAKKIGLMDIKQGDQVTVQYYSPYPGQFIVVSITYNSNL